MTKEEMDKVQQMVATAAAESLEKFRSITNFGGDLTLIMSDRLWDDAAFGAVTSIDDPLHSENMAALIVRLGEIYGYKVTLSKSIDVIPKDLFQGECNKSTH